MKTAVIFGSHRRTGKNKEIEDMLISLNLPYEFDFIRMADSDITGCTSCYHCGSSGKCVIDDDFDTILQRLIEADAILIISPVYASIPSRLTALFERLTSLLFASGVINTDKNPLSEKRAGVFVYCSSKICDESHIKMLFQKFLMSGYSFTDVNYDYINNCPDADEKYNHDICEYIKDVMIHF